MFIFNVFVVDPKMLFCRKDAMMLDPLTKRDPKPP
jgi:hypothetical protein